jgi:hypothetical protein
MILAFFVVIAYLGIAAISARATVVPDTLQEWARIAVLVLLALAAQWWGGVGTANRRRVLYALRGSGRSTQ